jgi:hypothetical protein
MTLKPLYGAISKQEYWPLSYTPEQVNLEDLLCSLSNQCRFAGNVPHFYSVLSHSLAVEAMVDFAFSGLFTDRAIFDLQFLALVHDFTEGVLLDIPRPYKEAVFLRDGSRFIQFEKYEETLLPIIIRGLGVLDRESATVEEIIEKHWHVIKTFDTAMLQVEREVLKGIPCDKSMSHFTPEQKDKALEVFHEFFTMSRADTIDHARSLFTYLDTSINAS